MILSFELSTRAGSIALCDGAKTIASRVWDDQTARHGEFWPALAALKGETQLDWSALQAIAVGRGPGSFSGLRAALTAARVLATPDACPVLAVSSGAALALEWFDNHADARTPLVVAGDARRGAIWFAIFERANSGLRQTRDWSLAPATAFSTFIPTGATIVTSDTARLRAALGAGASTIPLKATDFLPTAIGVARLARQRLQEKLPGEPLEPLYLHPATAG